jgi:predicted RNA binding protein YcfA (HicA-like mRNA interferase family)
MEKLPRVTAAEAIKVLERAGFLLVRQSGSHKMYKNKEGKRVTCLIMLGEHFIPRFCRVF